MRSTTFGVRVGKITTHSKATQLGKTTQKNALKFAPGFYFFAPP